MTNVEIVYNLYFLHWSLILQLNIYFLTHCALNLHRISSNEEKLKTSPSL